MRTDLLVAVETWPGLIDPLFKANIVMEFILWPSGL
jgi:hypothetical protein